MLTIKCAKCKTKMFKYHKIGKGRVLHLWKQRIIKDYTVRKGNMVMCRCGNIIGLDQSKWIKMRQKAFTYTGTKTTH